MFLFVHSYCKACCADFFKGALQISFIIIIIITLLRSLIAPGVHPNGRSVIAAALWVQLVFGQC